MKIETRERDALTNRFEAEAEAGPARRPGSFMPRGLSHVVTTSNWPLVGRLARLPAGAEILSGLGARRAVFATLVSATVLFLAGWLAVILAADGFSLLDGLLVGALVVEALWTAHNAWNAILGFLLVRVFRRPTEAVFPPAARAHDNDAVFTRTAILMTLRNEDCAAAFGRMRTIKESVDATGHGGQFDYFILSDSNTPEAIAAEEAAIAEWRAEATPARSDTGGAR